MGKLHEILAVEGDLASTSKKILDEARKTFSDKPAFFLGSVAVTTYFDDAKRNLDKTEIVTRDTTVQDKLDYVAGTVSRYWDAYYAKEATNQVAVADVVLDGKVFASAVPATVLLGMESKLKELRSVYETTPTLKPGLDWRLSPDLGAGVYAAHERDAFVTENQIIPVELAKATDKHAAQVTTVNRDVPVAKKEITSQSGMWSVAEKSDHLERVDALIRAVKEARQRANSVDALDTGKGFGKKFFDYIHG